MRRAFVYALLLSSAFALSGSVNAARADVEEPVSLSWRVGGVIGGTALWENYKARFLTADGRIVDTGNSGSSHSEGQGYGLLLAVAADDRPAFDLILSWMKARLFVRDDHLIAWKEGDPNDAADADILTAWALAEAADLWRQPAYATTARQIARDIRDSLVTTQAGYGAMLRPGLVGYSKGERGDGPVVNPSYWVLPAFNRLRQLAPGEQWSALVRTDVALLQSARLTDADLVTDWVALGEAKPKAADGFPKSFSYNSIRIPLYLFWSGTAAPEFTDRFVKAWTPLSAATSEFSEPGYQSVASLARCAASAQAYPASFYEYSRDQNYYPATLHLLSVVAAVMRGGPCLDETAMTRMLSRRGMERGLDLASIAAPTEAERAPAPVISSISPPTRAGASVHVPLIAATYASDEAEGGRWEVKNLILNGLQILGAALGLGAAFAWFRQKRASKITRKIEDVFDETRGTIPNHHGKASVPRVLPENPFHQVTPDALFGARIEYAAALSVEYGRTLGVLLIDLNDCGRDAAFAADEVDELLAALPRILRSTDCVRLINEHEIIVVAPLLEGLEQLDRIGARICALGKENDALGAAFASGAGSAIYPVCGYRGDDLIEHARRRYRAMRWASASKARVWPRA